MKMMLQVKDLKVSLAGTRVLADINFCLEEGQHLAVIGASGSGKTTLVKALSREIFFFGEVLFPPNSRIYVISRQHRFNNLSNRSDFYYQQRFNSFDAEDSRTVEEELLARGADMKGIDEVLTLLGIEHVRNTGLIQLSNGEHKRFQIAEALIEKPDWIILDSPYIGLDVRARVMLNDILDGLMARGIQVILVTGHGEISSSITHVAVLEDGKLSPLVPHGEFAESGLLRKPELHSPDPGLLRSLPIVHDHPDFEYALRMEEVSIRYGNKLVLDHVSWEVKRGECWSLSGHNGSGKSTLLSLVNGDNPQAFANRIWIFDKRKGSGESIWDIKRHIGYISPELHHYFETGSPCLDIVASGLFDTMGLFRKLSPAQEELALKWMQVLGIGHFAGRMFQRLSDSEQRRVLLARALVKNPPVLILDEPCQGLDDAETENFISIINTICTELSKTLIYVTHYEAELPSCVTRKIVLANGTVSSIQ